MYIPVGNTGDALSFILGDIIVRLDYLSVQFAKMIDIMSDVSADLGGDLSVTGSVMVTNTPIDPLTVVVI
jgi:hypothetical protein